MFKKISASLSLSDKVSLELLQKIELGELSPGTKLPTEPELSKLFGVSRTVVREAISRLKNEGMVESRQGSGIYVSEQSQLRPLRIKVEDASSIESVMQIVELRRAIESEVAALVAVRRTPKHLAAIGQALAAITADMAAGGNGVLADVAFHRSIADAAGNPFLLKTLIFLNQFLEAATLVTRSIESRRDDFMREVQEEHSAIFEAIRTGDAVAARAAAQTHMFNVARRLAQGSADSTTECPLPSLDLSGKNVLLEFDYANTLASKTTKGTFIIKNILFDKKLVTSRIATVRGSKAIWIPER